VNRRSFISLTSAAALSVQNGAAATTAIVDTHIHLFDPTRPQGVPWPDKANTVLYQPALPDRYRKISGPLGITGAIVVEASPWVEDNQWVLDITKNEPLILGLVGNLEPGKPEFAKQFERFQKDRRFLGIRYGNLWGRDLAAQVSRTEFVQDVKLLAKAGLSLDTANQNPKLISAVVKLTDAVPDLRVIIDHLPQMRTPEQTDVMKQYRQDLRTLGKRPQVYVKLSEVFRRVDGQVPRDLSNYRETLDDIYTIFGDDRVLYGSDWPNSDTWRPFGDGLRLMQEYFATKSPAAAEKYFWKNSVAAYRWKK
jgi:L-fuconolactonase